MPWDEVVSRWKDTLLKENENRGIIELVWGRTGKGKGTVKLIEYSPFCPYMVDLDYYKNARRSFTTEEWIDMLVAAADYNPAGYEPEEQKLCFLRRLLPFAEKGLTLFPEWIYLKKKVLKCGGTNFLSDAQPGRQYA